MSKVLVICGGGLSSSLRTKIMARLLIEGYALKLANAVEVTEPLHYAVADVAHTEYCESRMHLEMVKRHVQYQENKLQQQRKNMQLWQKKKQQRIARSRTKKPAKQFVYG